MVETNRKAEHALYMRQWYDRNPLGKKPHTLKCQNQRCTKKFLSRNKNQKFCSYTCSRRNGSKYKNCVVCGEEFLLKKGNLKLKTCSPICRKVWQKRRIGELGANWQGGKTDINILIRGREEIKRWKILVFERDNYTCQLCGDKTGGNLHAHHIKRFSDNSELRIDINNGITLCDKCHINKVTWHEKDWEKLFIRILKNKI